MFNLDRKAIVGIFLLSGLLGLGLSLYMHKKNLPDTATSTMPTFHSPALFVKQLANDNQAGEKIFNAFCVTCHASKPSIETNAPRLSDKEKWKLLRRAGMQGLMPVTLQGAGAMPARGGCFECSDEQLQETVKYMLDKSR